MAAISEESLYPKASYLLWCVGVGVLCKLGVIINTLPRAEEITVAAPCRQATARCFLCVCACSVAQLCPAPCNSMDYSAPGSSICGILQARILEWVAISFSRGFPDPGIKPGSPALKADSLPSEASGKFHFNTLSLFNYLANSVYFTLIHALPVIYIYYRHRINLLYNRGQLPLLHSAVNDIISGA